MRKRLFFLEVFAWGDFLESWDFLSVWLDCGREVVKSANPDEAVFGLINDGGVLARFENSEVEDGIFAAFVVAVGGGGVDFLARGGDELVELLGGFMHSNILT